MKIADQIIDEIERWVKEKFKGAHLYREKGGFGEYDLLVSKKSLEKVETNRIPKPDFGFRPNEKDYIFIEVEAHKSRNLISNVVKYWKLLEFWKAEEKKSARIFLIHALDEERKEANFSQENQAKFIADRIRKEFDFQYFQLYSWEPKEIEDKICCLISLFGVT